MRKTFSLPVAATAAGGGVTPPPADTVDNIEHSVRFNPADSAYLSWTPASAGNRKTWTWAGWVKRSSSATVRQSLFTSANNNFVFRFQADSLYYYDYTGSSFLSTFTTAAVYRDYSAWLHVVFVYDSTNATSSERIRLYVNGSRVQLSTVTYPTSNADSYCNNNVEHRIAGDPAYTTRLLDGYLADIHFVDGQALTPSSFGFTDSNGVWQPKAYTGSYDNLLKLPSATITTSGTPWSSTREWDDFFANTLSDAVYAASGATHTVTFSPALNVSSEVKITKWSGQGISTAEYVLNGSVTRTVSNFTNHVDTISSATLGGSLSSITVETVGGSDAATVIELTVDGKPVRLDTISGNGFHLDFADTSSATALGNDVSGNNNDWTPSGLVAGPAYTANSWSTEFDGSGDYLTTPSDTNVGFGTGDFTVEAWFYSNGTQNTYASIISLNDGSGGTDWQFEASGSTISVRNLFSASTNYTHNEWHHVAWTRQGSSNYLFLDGVQVGTVSDSTDYDYGSFYVGANRGLNYFFNGKISNVRVIKGRALYTAAFTPPTTALTATDDTVLLTCQDATVRDNSNIGHDVTASGDVAVVNQGPFNGYSGEFDGSGDYLTAASSDFALGTGDYTIETWVYHNALNNNAFVCTGTSAGSGNWQIGQNGGTVYFYLSGTTFITGSGVTVNTWHHVTATRSGSTVRLFIDGVLKSSTTNSSNLTDTNLRIGFNRGGSVYFDGKISNLRITKGQALYTSNFTPPTADLTTTSQGATASNVKLLTCQNSTFIDNSPSAHTITVNGDAHTVSVNPHTDKYSVSFSSPGNNIVCTPPTLTGEFTIECWVKCNGSGEIFGNWNVNPGDTILLRYAGGYLQLYSALGSINEVFSPGTEWRHIALTRDSSNVVRLFADGSQIGTLTSSNSLSLPAFCIGAENASSGSIAGHISNFRIVDGQALYTSNFLPPTEDLTTTSQGATASNVKLLTCQSYKIQDNSPSPLTLTVNGTAAPSTDAPFVTSGAGSFDGTGDYLTISNNSDHDLGSGDFTIEGWFKTSATISYQTIIHKYFGPTAYDGWYIALDSNGTGFYATLGAGSNPNVILTGGSNLNNGAWHHFAVTRSSNTARLFLDGSLITSANSSNNITATSDLRISGIAGYPRDWNGQLSNIRIVKGQALYTANFTPPTEDFDPTDQDTTFLALQGNTLDDLAGDHAVTANGNAATTTVSPFEPVDGSDAMLDSPTNYGSGDLVRGNYCTLNPLTTSNATRAPSDGNLVMAFGGTYPTNVLGTFGVSSGKWYWEVGFAGGSSGSGHACGVANGAWANKNVDPDNQSTPNHYIDSRGYFYNSGTGTTNNTNFGPGDIIGIALDVDNDEVSFYLNGTIVGSAQTLETGQTWFPFHKNSSFTALTQTVNFGQQPFKYPAPAGYKSLCSTNLPTGTVTTSGSFTGTGTADGPFIYLNGVPTAMTINSNSVTFGTDADKLSNGFKVRSSNASYNSTGTNTYSITTTGDTFNRSRAQTNP